MDSRKFLAFSQYDEVQCRLSSLSSPLFIETKQLDQNVHIYDIEKAMTHSKLYKHGSCHNHPAVTCSNAGNTATLISQIIGLFTKVM